MASLSSQIKAKLQNIGSPKIKITTNNNMPPPQQSPTSSQYHKIPLNKPPQREDKSQSPDEYQNSSKDVLQRLQMKNLAFIPGKGQSPINQTMLNCQNQFSNLNTSNSNDQSQTSQIMKISPQRIMGMNGNKMIIPANQIKIIKKDGTSPSPENRQPNTKQLSPSSITFMIQQQNQNQNQIDSISNNQNMNPNILANNGNLPRHSHQKQSARTLTSQQSAKTFQSSQLSDDETNINSDNEEKSITTMSQMKSDTSNFNRPKINTQLNNYTGQSEDTFHDNTLTQQRTQRGSQLSTFSNQNSASDSHRVKIISQIKIRQSPSPPPNQVLKNNDKPPQVAKIQTQYSEAKTQPTLQTQPSQSQLASDYIKGMINQSRTNNSLNQSVTQKKIIGTGINTLKKGLISKQSFQKEMKKHGIEKDIQEVSQFVKPVIDISPPRQEESNNQLQNKNASGTSNNPVKPKPPQKISLSKISHLRNYSPPPNFDQGGLSNLQEIKDNNKVVSKPTENSPTNISTQNGEEQTTITTGEGTGGVFQFPFQRRARSLSLPKQEIIQNKMNQKNAQINPNPTPGENQDKTSQSPNRQLEEQRRNKPVVAKINFAIAHKGLMKKDDEEAIFERNKEVDEWLMGSGESDNTAGSNNSNKVQQVPGISVTVRSSILSNQPGKRQQSELEKPIQPDSQNNGNDDSVEEEEEDWMFRTFDKIKSGKGGKPIAKTNRTNNINSIYEKDPNKLGVKPREFNLNDDFGESPFDMAPDLQKQFSKPQNQKDFEVEDDDFMLDNIASDCQDISQFIDKIDQFMERIQ